MAHSYSWTFSPPFSYHFTRTDRLYALLRQVQIFIIVSTCFRRIQGKRISYIVKCYIFILFKELLCFCFKYFFFCRFGRRLAILLDCLPLIVGWLLTWQAQCLEHLYIARAITGVGIGAGVPIASMYLRYSSYLVVWYQVSNIVQIISVSISHD